MRFLKVKTWAKEVSKYRYHIFLSIAFFAFAVIGDVLSGMYIDERGIAIASDLFLEFIPPMDLSYLFTYSFIVIASILILYPLFFKVDKVHIFLSQFGFLVLVRSLFIPLTHLKAPADMILPHFPSFFNWFAFSNDLFFSGHVAVPFLGYLLIDYKPLKYFFLFMSVIMAFTVLAMHVHYSIDVFSAYFITYGTFKLGQNILKSLKQI